ncbi:MAG TPA: multidrug efflux SMR transporter [Pseudonocardiaceae bacterium]
MPGYFYLSVAICSEVVGTLALRYTHGFMKLFPSLIVIFTYSLAFYMLSLALRNIPVGIAYAIWSGVGTAIVAIAAAVLFGERLTIAAVAGLALIIFGVVLLEMNSSLAAGSSIGSGS